MKKFSGSEDFAKSLEPDYSSFETSSSSSNKSPVINSVHSKNSSADSSVHHSFNNNSSNNSGSSLHPRRRVFDFVSIIFLFLLLLFVFFLSASVDANPFIVFLSFLPVVLTIVFSLLIYESFSNNFHSLWVLPLILVFLFNWFGKGSYSLFSGIDVDVLSVLNLFVSYLFLLVVFLALRSPSRVVERVVVKEKDVPFQLSDFIASIEDKSKALNFVIGRVYNAYHGGSRELREKINMKQEWYDEFSEIVRDPDNVDFAALEALISKIEDRLSRLTLPEKQVFGSAHKSFKNLVRDPHGNDRVIDVLDKNDKDPVFSYYEGALQFCGKVRDYIARRSVPEVKNDYVPRSDDSNVAKNSGSLSSGWSRVKKFFSK